MSSRGKGRDNKRKFSGHHSFNNKKRNFDEGFPRNERRLNKFHYNSNNNMPNYNSRNYLHGRSNYYRPNQYHRLNSHKNLDYPPAISTDSHIEQEEDIAGNSTLNSERLEKVLATKKRIEEAFASKSSNTSNQEIAFEKPVMKETSTDNKEKNTDGNVQAVDNLELRLTNSDFKEIGSVASGVEVEGETDASDLMLNVAPCSSQQRSFDQICPSTLPSSSKHPRVSGWNVTALNGDETEPLHSNRRVIPLRTSRPIRQQFLQKSNEEILGSIEPNNEKQSIGLKKTKTGLASQRSPRMYSSRVGQLYQSFLRSRLFGGFALRFSNSTPKPVGPNPFLDKSVLESPTYESSSGSQTFQLEMPRPIMIKLEANKTTDLEGTSNYVEAEEANEFCQEFSHLLTEPNYLIPAEELEKLGLGHLAEMNKLVNERRISGGSPNMSVNNESCLRVRSLTALNSVTENDITYNPATSNAMSSSPSEYPLINNFSNVSPVQSRHQAVNYEFVNVPGINEAQISGVNSKVPSNPPSSTMAQDPLLQDIHTPVAESLSVESVAEKVINKLFSSTNVNSQVLSPGAELLLRKQILQSNLMTNQNETSTPGVNNSLRRPTNHTNQDPTNQLQDIGSKVLRMFVIDKQIEELREEKMDIYKEILSIGEISSSLLNSWAQEKIQKRNPRNVPSEQPNDSANNCNTNSLVNSPSSIPSVLSEPVSNSVQNVVVEPRSTNNLSYNAITTSNVPSVSSQCMETQHIKQLSVRTDLLNTNNPRLSNDLNALSKDNGGGSEVLKTSAVVKTEPLLEAVNENTPRKSKKKKKGKNKEKPEDIIYLIEDSSDEENCSVSVCSSGVGTDLLANDGSLSKTTNSEPTILTYDLYGNTPTCIYQYKGVLVVGSKDGTVLVFNIQDANALFLEKVNGEAVNCISVYMKQAIFGSSDGTIILFSLEKQRKTQTVHTPSSVQCVEVRHEKLYIGTKSGHIATYKINVKTSEKGFVELSLKCQETRKVSNSSIIGLKVAQMEDEEVTIVASRGEQIAVYFTDTGRLLTRFDWCDTVHCLAVLSQTPLVYCGTHTQSVKVVNFVTGQNEPDCLVGTTRSVTKIIVKSTLLFAASIDGKVYIYDTKVNKLISTVVACKGQIIGMQIYKKVIVVASNRSELNAVTIPAKVEALLKMAARSKSNS